MTIRPLSSRVIFVAPRNMTPRATVRPFPPPFSHQAPHKESAASYVNSNSEKFVAVTKTYVENHSVGRPCGAFVDNNQRFARRPLALMRPRTRARSTPYGARRRADPTPR